MATLKGRIIGREIIPENYGRVCSQLSDMPGNSPYKPKVPCLNQAGSIPAFNV